MAARERSVIAVAAGASGEEHVAAEPPLGQEVDKVT